VIRIGRNFNEIFLLSALTVALMSVLKSIVSVTNLQHLSHSEYFMHDEARAISAVVELSVTFLTVLTDYRRTYDSVLLTYVCRFLIGKGARLDAVNNDGELPVDLADGSNMENLLSEAMDTQGARSLWTSLFQFLIKFRFTLIRRRSTDWVKEPQCRSAQVWHALSRDFTVLPTVCSAHPCVYLRIE